MRSPVGWGQSPLVRLRATQLCAQGLLKHHGGAVAPAGREVIWAPGAGGVASGSDCKAGPSRLRAVNMTRTAARPSALGRAAPVPGCFPWKSYRPSHLLFSHGGSSSVWHLRKAPDALLWGRTNPRPEREVARLPAPCPSARGTSALLWPRVSTLPPSTTVPPCLRSRRSAQGQPVGSVARGAGAL